MKLPFVYGVCLYRVNKQYRNKFMGGKCYLFKSKSINLPNLLLQNVVIYFKATVTCQATCYETLQVIINFKVDILGTLTKLSVVNLES